MEIASVRPLRRRFENAIAVNPDVAATYVLQGIYLYRAKRLPAAVTSLEKAVKLDPDSLNAHYNLGLVYFETKQFELANAHAQRAYQLGARYRASATSSNERANGSRSIRRCLMRASSTGSDSQPPRPRDRYWGDAGHTWCSPREGRRPPSRYFVRCRVPRAIDQVVATFRMLRRRRSANRPGVRSHGVKSRQLVDVRTGRRNTPCRRNGGANIRRHAPCARAPDHSPAPGLPFG